LHEQYRQSTQAFVRVDELAGGVKNMEMSVYLAALNHVPVSAVRAKILELLQTSGSLRYFEESWLEVLVLVQHQESRDEKEYGRLEPLVLYTQHSLSGTSVAVEPQGEQPEGGSA
jgi:hypothetical protein